jgi:hypothetical protein
MVVAADCPMDAGKKEAMQAAGGKTSMSRCDGLEGDKVFGGEPFYNK